MMDKKDKAERLLDSIGNIDDSLIDEAIGYKAARRVNLYRFGLMAACIALVFVIAVASPLLRKLAEVGNGGAQGGENNNGVVENTDKNEGNEDEVGNDRLGTYMLSIRDSIEGYDVYPSAENLSYVGQTSLVWRYADSDEVYVATLSSKQLGELKEAMGSGKEVGEVSPELDCYVWIVDGQGAVVSPYLKDGAGNEGCVIFDYEAEIIPDEEFVECVSEILK
ncbi:MAG: hypothetical protein E7592_07700 [Ruminococcaceae bacterium]|nr:hypothetical protein [Oscillospiraceae bacterium]